MKRILSIASLMLISLSSFAEGRDFAFGLLSRIASGDESNVIFISPQSVSIALAMTANGAEGITRSEILSVIGADEDIKTVNKSYHSNMEYLTAGRKGITLDIANSLWISDRFGLKRSAARKISKNYGAMVSALDFANPASVSAINGWCSSKTAGRIEKIIESLSPQDVMYIINALYFKGQWTRPFDASDSRNADFHGISGNSETRFMHDRGYYPFHIGSDVSILELGYGDGSMAMDIILPAEGTDMSDFILNFGMEEYEALTEKMATAEIRIGIPSFKADYEITLNSVLQSLGMKAAFSSSADFSGFSDEPLAVSKVLQKTFIEINEEGSEAAAVTAIGIMRTSLGPEPPEFIADRPFIFLIKDTASGTILFCGMVRNL